MTFVAWQYGITVLYSTVLYCALCCGQVVYQDNGEESLSWVALEPILIIGEDPAPDLPLPGVEPPPTSADRPVDIKATDVEAA